MVLAKLDVGRRALAEAKSVEEVKDLRDRAVAIQDYLCQQRWSLEAQNDAAELKLRAERKLGGLLKSQVRGFGQRDETYRNSTFVPPKLETMGISRNQSSSWQALDDVPEETFEANISTVREQGDRLNTAGVLRLARLSAERPEPPPFIRKALSADNTESAPDPELLIFALASLLTEAMTRGLSRRVALQRSPGWLTTVASLAALPFPR